ncbi:MAG: hypothetical protein ABSB78_13545 [Bacteroidota bacterium]
MTHNHSSSSFGAYEGLRILLPGFYCVTLAWLYGVVAFNIDLYFTGSSASTLLILVSGSIAGLLLYATEGSKRRKAFRENQPSQHILELSRTLNISPPIDEREAQRLYFFILNSYMPAPFHQRIFFFGMVFHVLTTIRRISLFFAIAGFFTLGTFAVTQQFDRVTPSLIVVILFLLFIYMINARYNKADRKMQENYQDQIQWLTMNQKLVLYIIQHREAPVPAAGKEY